MTKVKKTNARKTGTASVASTQSKALTDKTVVSAVRNGETRNFPANLWNHLPEDKEGWKETQEKPADLPRDKGNFKTDEELLAEGRKAVIEQYVKIIGVQPENGMSIHEMNEAIEAHNNDDDDQDDKGSKDNDADDDADLIDHILTQDDLDQNPQWAAEKMKVGDKVRVKKEA